MINPSQAWCHQIDLTNLCALHCSNCTRLLDHVTKRFFISLECFEQAVIAVKDFPTKSDPCPQGRRKVVGIIGGEPLLHPQFPEIVDIMCKHIPEVRYRGLWTSKDWKNDSHPKWGPYRPHVEKLIGKEPLWETRGPSTRYTSGYINWNMHLPEMACHHQPLLVAIKDVVKDEKKMWEMIQDCWVQREWSPTITDKGFFFCEVAGAFDQAMKGEGGLPLTSDVWKGKIWFENDANGVPVPMGPYAEQIKKWCPGCGACLKLPGRLDSEDRDDVSQSNLVQLQLLGSPRVKKGDIVEFKAEAPVEAGHGDPNWKPFDYVKGAKPRELYMKDNPSGPANQPPPPPARRPKTFRPIISSGYPIVDISRGPLKPVKGIVVCVDYGDLLKLTLPINRHHLSELLIVTTERDKETQELAKQHNAKLHVTDAFYRNGASFNKGLAMEEGFDILGREGWILVFDADIVFPSTMKLATMEIGRLYSPRRRILLDLEGFPATTPPWHTLTLRDDKELYGYFQLFHGRDPALVQKRPWYGTDWKHAGGCDAIFQDHWPEAKKARPKFEVLHLGSPDANWFGRSTPRADGEEGLPNAQFNGSLMRSMLDERRRQPRYPMRGLPSERINPT